MGDYAKWVKSRRRRKRERERERAKVGDNNGQTTHGARKPPGPKSVKFLLNYIKSNCLPENEQIFCILR